MISSIITIIRLYIPNLKYGNIHIDNIFIKIPISSLRTNFFDSFIPWRIEEREGDI